MDGRFHNMVSEPQAWCNSTVANGREGVFASQLRPVDAAAADSWVWLAYDQLNLAFIKSLNPSESWGVVFVESPRKAGSRPYHQQKLGVLLSNQRHAAIELQALGIPVLYLFSKTNYAMAIEEAVSILGPIHAFNHAERELRVELAPLTQNGSLLLHPHPGWITPRDWFETSVGVEPPFRMDKFYRKVRKETGWMMVEGKPIGGKYSFDAENRFPWKGDPSAPEPPIFAKDGIDDEVESLIATHYAGHPGQVDLRFVPTSLADVKHALSTAMEALPNFGRYEDAMSERSRGLFHSRLATLLNLHRIMPIHLAEEVLGRDVPLNSKEGFIRQLIWREYVHHIHEVTDGFRTLKVQRLSSTRGAQWPEFQYSDEELHPNHLNQTMALPQAYWDSSSGMRCLDASVEAVMDDGWTHHIPRLMVLSNIANLLDVDPRELTDWFHAAFIDAYDWVVEPNVLGMGTFALGTAMMTKPYVAGSAYINRMSDHCGSCQFHHKKTCPMTRLYWAFLDRHSPSFDGNHRMAMAMKNIAKRSQEEKERDQATFEHVRTMLTSGKTLRPEGVSSLQDWS